jgi:hypothetical protein
VSFKDSDLSTDHSAQLLAYKNLTLINILLLSSSPPPPSSSSSSSSLQKCTWRTGVCLLLTKNFLFALRNGGTGASVE